MIKSAAYINSLIENFFMVCDKSKVYFILREGITTLMTSEVTLYLMKNLHLHNVSIHKNCYQNRFINEYVRNG